ncbi:D-alanine aminotransferase [mine drainage metagenome]|uniref:D-alanine aminotransferase n=1 Tax=mine drainage metagenome TaxID=410659 RepID=A0A1J5QMF4_9ZZZZ
MRESICHLNGAYLPLDQARVSVLDRGFIFGDGVYEVVPAYARRPFRFDQHIARLGRSLREIGMADPLGREAWLALVTRLLADNDPADQCIYIQITRGVARRDHAFPKDAPSPTVFAYSFPFPHVPQALREQGAACITLPDTRWLRAHIKSIALLGNVLARQASAELGAQETILIRDGWLTEASASNVWLVRHGRLLCPPMDNLKLEGVRVGLMDELAQVAGVPLERRPVAEWELRCADEILLSSATKEVLAVTTLDGRAVATGHPGPVYAALHAAYQVAKQTV